jgi:methylenetetrahydrofolate reductase (NADPH)
MIKKITEIFKEKNKTFSFEFFPPKTPVGLENLYNTVEELTKLVPDFISVTYGAGGSTRGATMEICASIQKRFDIPVMHHFTCVGHSQKELMNTLDLMKTNNIKNILALRGDPPAGIDKWEPSSDGFEYCYQLIDLIRGNHKEFFSIGVAGFPEGHVNCPDKETDTEHLKIKIDNGGEFIVSQLFFNNSVYYEYLKRLKKHNINVRVLPGILPITNYEGLLKFCKTCGATVTKEVHDIFNPIKNDEEATRKAGVEFAVRQCRDLLDHGAPGLHFFTLNKAEPTKEIWSKLKI